jgi:predicted TIM-barrel fold metal-dependent hydrolase
MTATFRVFDTHSHVHERLFGTKREDGSYDVAADADYRLGVMKRTGVHACIVMANHVYERPNGIADTRRMNDFVAWYRDAYPDQFPVAIGTVEPLYGIEAGLAEINRMAAELKLDGVTWHHMFHGASMADARMVAFAQELGRLRLPAFLHFNGETVLEAPYGLETLARKAPDTTFVALSSLFSGQSIADMRSIGQRCPNVIFETSFSRPIGRVIEQFAQTFGSERVIFGTDMVPYAARIYRQAPGLVDILESDLLSDDDKRNILWGNAARLFPALRRLDG